MNKDIISRGDALAVVQYSENKVEGIENLPAADAVTVVRCKDCVHWACYGGADSHKGDCLELAGLDSCMYEDDFCSYGEPKDGE